MPAWLTPLRPPVLLLLSLALSIALHWFLPGLPLSPVPWHWIGVPVMVAGIALIGWSVRVFDRARTSYIPGDRSKVLLVRGPFRWTRNPIYVGMATISAGVALLLNDAMALLGTVAYVVAVTRLFIVREEALLAKRFGASYRAYRARVGRWLP